jgi:hypothetical protein
MNQAWEHREHRRAYYVCLAATLMPILIVVMLPVATLGLDQLPYALFMSVFVVLPFLSCGRQLRGRPLFQFHYHGTPFVKEVMDISEDERVFEE